MTEYTFQNGCKIVLSEDKKAARLYSKKGTLMASMPYTGEPLEVIGKAMIFGYFAGWTGCYDKIKEQATKMLEESKL